MKQLVYLARGSYSFVFVKSNPENKNRQDNVVTKIVAASNVNINELIAFSSTSRSPYVMHTLGIRRFHPDDTTKVIVPKDMVEEWNAFVKMHRKKGLLAIDMPRANFDLLDLFNAKTSGIQEPYYDLPIPTVMLEISFGLHHIHALGYIHGDLKPENVLLFKNERGTYSARVADLGFLTPRNELEMYVHGTPSYMPPEKWCAKESVTHTDTIGSDVFSLGMIWMFVINPRLFLDKTNASSDFVLNYLKAVSASRSNSDSSNLVSAFESVGFPSEQWITSFCDSDLKSSMSSLGKDTKSGPVAAAAKEPWMAWAKDFWANPETQENMAHIGYETEVARKEVQDMVTRLTHENPFVRIREFYKYILFHSGAPLEKKLQLEIENTLNRIKTDMAPKMWKYIDAAKPWARRYVESMKRKPDKSNMYAIVHAAVRTGLRSVLHSRKLQEIMSLSESMQALFQEQDQDLVSNLDILMQDLVFKN